MKVKGFYLILVFVLVMMVSFPLMNDIAFADMIESDVYDKAFIEIISQIFMEEEIESGNLIANREFVYDLDLNKLGYIYNFKINLEDGYAILIDEGFGIEMTEIFFDCEMPYTNKDSLNIYISDMLYLEYNVDIGFTYKDYLLTDDLINELRSIAYYSGSNDYISTEETISYRYKNVNEYKTAHTHPYCKSIPLGLSNACVPIAAGNLVQYYDRFCDDLLPNYIPGRLFGSKYIYAQQSKVVDDAILQLYYDIGTNTIESGATVDQFKSGLSKFCNRQNYSVEYNECVSNKQLNYSLCKEFLKKDTPIALFVTKYTIVIENEKENEDNIQNLLYVSNHCMIAFGYKEIQYTMSDNKNIEKRYMQVATGLASYSKGYISVTNNLDINNAIAVKIY